MKALSIVKPWGEMIANKSKRLEIRSWHPDTLPMIDIALVENSKRLTKADDEDTQGLVVAIIDITAYSSWVKADHPYSGCDESAFEEGWLAWTLSNIRKLEKPVPAMAKRKFYELSDAEALAVQHEVNRKL